MKKIIITFLTMIILGTFALTLSSCKSEEERALENFNSALKVAEQQRREAEDKLRAIENYKFYQYIYEQTKP